MRILWLQWRDIRHPWSGGAEIYMHQISRRLARMGHKVVAVTSWYPGLKKYENIDGYYVQRVANHDNYILHVPKILHNYSRWVDVIVEDTSKAPLMTPLLRFKDMPVIAVVHHLNREIYFQEIPLRRGLIAYTLETIMPYIYSRLPQTRIIAVSKSTKEELTRLGADPSKIHIVQNAIDEDELLSNPNSYQKNSVPTVIYFSRLKKYKQPHHALLAFRRVVEEMPGAKLIVAGKGTETLRKYAEKLGIGDNVEVYGEVDEKSKKDLFCRAWILIQTSRKEGFGITVLEAATCKTPAVAYDVPGLRDSVRHMETGMLVPAGDIDGLAEAILRLLGDESLRSRLAENAYKHAQQHTWDKIAEEFAKTLIEALTH